MVPMWGSLPALGGLGALGGNGLGYIRLGPSEKEQHVCKVGDLTSVCFGVQFCCLIRTRGPLTHSLGSR